MMIECQEAVKGHCHLFWLERSGRLRFEVVVNRRVLPSKVVMKEDYGMSDLFFIECCNFVDMPTKLKGTLCALMLTTNPKLCIILFQY